MEINSIKIRTTFSDIKAYEQLLGQYMLFVTKYGKILKYTTGYERGAVKEKPHFHTHFIMKDLKLPKTNLQQTYKYFCKTKNLKTIPGKYTLSLIAEVAQSEERTLAYPLKNCEGPLGLCSRGELMHLSNLDNEDWINLWYVAKTIRNEIVIREDKKKQEQENKSQIKEKLFKYIDLYRDESESITEIGMLVVRYFFEEEDNEICMYPDKWVMKYMRTKHIITDYQLFNYLTKLKY